MAWKVNLTRLAGYAVERVIYYIIESVNVRVGDGDIIDEGLGVGEVSLTRSIVLLHPDLYLVTVPIHPGWISIGYIARLDLPVLVAVPCSPGDSQRGLVPVEGGLPQLAIGSATSRIITIVVLALFRIPDSDPHLPHRIAEVRPRGASDPRLPGTGAEVLIIDVLGEGIEGDTIRGALGLKGENLGSRRKGISVPSIIGHIQIDLVVHPVEPLRKHRIGITVQLPAGGPLGHYPDRVCLPPVAVPVRRCAAGIHLYAQPHLIYHAIVIAGGAGYLIEVIHRIAEGGLEADIRLRIIVDEGILRRREVLEAKVVHRPCLDGVALTRVEIRWKRSRRIVP